MNSNNMCQENEQESQQIEWKWSWQDDFLNGYVVMPTQMAAHYILE